MKNLLLFILPLLAVAFNSCSKGESPEPDFHQTYYVVQYKRYLDNPNTPEYTEIIKVELSFVNSILTVSFQTNDELVGDCVYTFTEPYQNVYRQDYYAIHDTKINVAGYEENSHWYGTFYRQRNSPVVSLPTMQFEHYHLDGYTITVNS